MTVGTGSVRSVPVAAFAHAGELVIATDDGEWVKLVGETVTAMPGTGPISDVVAMADGSIAVATWDPRIERLRDGVWSPLMLSAPATALCATARGLVIADTGGGLSLLAGASQVPVQEMTTPEPVLQLVAIGDGIAALGSSGTVEVSAWPGGDTGLTSIHLGTVGRAHALFAGSRAGMVWVAGARGLGVIEGGARPRISAVTTELGERVSGVVPFGNGKVFAHGDGGEAWILDETVSRTQHVKLGAAIAGACAAGDGTVLVWTTDGALHTVGADGASWHVASEVVLAAPEPSRSGTIAIHWTPTAGLRVTRGHVAWN